MSGVYTIILYTNVMVVRRKGTRRGVRELKGKYTGGVSHLALSHQVNVLPLVLPAPLYFPRPP